MTQRVRVALVVFLCVVLVGLVFAERASRHHARHPIVHPPSSGPTIPGPL